MITQRLPQLPMSTDKGYVYVVKRNGVYKIGFTRNGLRRRTRDAGGTLALTIPTGQRPSQLEYALNRRFRAKGLPSQGSKDGDKREWFALDQSDIDWLRGLAAHCDHKLLGSNPDSSEVLKPQPIALDSIPPSGR